MFSRFRFVLAATAVLLLTVLGGCSTISVNYDFDNNVDFQKYQTYSWVRNSAVEGTPDGIPGLLDKRIRTSIANEMEYRKISYDKDQPDLMIAFHVGSKDKIQVTDWGYRYSNYYWGYGGRNIDVYSYTEGQLIIDLVDASSMQLVWRGSGTKVISQSQKSPEQMQAAIDEAVMKIMASFPPKTK